MYQKLSKSLLFLNHHYKRTQVNSKSTGYSEYLHGDIRFSLLTTAYRPVTADLTLLPSYQHYDYYDDHPECGGHSQSAHVWKAPPPHRINPISRRNSRSPFHSRNPVILPEAKDHLDTHNEDFGVIPQSFQLTNIWQMYFNSSSSFLRSTI